MNKPEVCDVVKKKTLIELRAFNGAEEEPEIFHKYKP